MHLDCEVYARLFWKISSIGALEKKAPIGTAHVNRWGQPRILWSEPYVHSVRFVLQTRCQKKAPTDHQGQWGHSRACPFKEPAMFREETIGAKPYLVLFQS
jgi:hypothetical protein